MQGNNAKETTSLGATPS